MDDDLVLRLRQADENSQQRIAGSRIFKEAADEIERLRAALLDLHHLIDFAEPITSDKPMLFEDASAINDAMKQALAALTNG